MEIVPVIDVKGGVAVHAVAGERARYRPLVTPLAPSPSPLAVASGLLGLYPFRTFYVADLDAIEGREPDTALVLELAQAWRGGEVWVDAGATFYREHAGGGLSSGITPVVGSESLESLPDLEARGQSRTSPCVLSLDFRGGEFLGPPALLDAPALWPERIIVMTLARVGTSAGPDLGRLGEVLARADGRRVYAAGGVRGPDDLEALRRAGAAGALVATALHGGQIKAGDLERIAGF